MKSGLPIAGKRVLVAGSGPLLLAVAAYLRQHGAEILMICEQASWSSLARFGLALLPQAGKLSQGFVLRRQLSGIPFMAGWWPVEARGHGKLEEVVISQGRAQRTKTIPCDFLACGFHLVPNTELAELLGCRRPKWPRAGRRFSADVDSGSVLCRRADWHRRSGAGADRGPDRRLRRGRPL